MGVDEFRSELATIKTSFDMQLIPDKEIYEKMCIEAQRRNLSDLGSLATDHPPLNITALKRLLWPVFITVSFLGIIIIMVIGFLYRSLSAEMKISNLKGKNYSTNNSSLLFPGANSIGEIANYTGGTAGTGGSDIGGSVELRRDKLKEMMNTSFSNNSDDSSNRSNYNSSSSSNSSNSSEISLEPLYYLSTSDGILSHFFQLQHLWAITHSLNRTLVPASFHSPNHHHDVQWINLCDIFELPTDIDCTDFNTQKIKNSEKSGKDSEADSTKKNKNGNSGLIFQKNEKNVPSSSYISNHLEPPQIVKTHKCTLLGIHSWALDPKMYYLPITKIAEKRFNFLDGDCVAGYVDDKSGFTLTPLSHPKLENRKNDVQRNDKISVNTNNNIISSFPYIKFKSKYLDMMILAKKALKLNSNGNFTVVHWIDEEGFYRKDKNKECSDDKKMTKEGICMSHQDFIRNVRTNLDENSKKNLIYIATDDRNMSILSDLTAAGFSHYSDLNMTFNSLDSSVLELVLMLESSHQIFWGHSLFKSFSELYRTLQQNNPIRNPMSN